PSTGLDGVFPQEGAKGTFRAVGAPAVEVGMVGRARRVVVVTALVAMTLLGAGLAPAGASTGSGGGGGGFRPGAPGVGDDYFPLYGNGGYDVRPYLLKGSYDPAPHRLAGGAQTC